MSYRAFKRLLGETSLERKCRFLFGGFILLLITSSFWLYARQTEGLAYEQMDNMCRLLVPPIVVSQHTAKLSEMSKTNPLLTNEESVQMAKAIEEFRLQWEDNHWDKEDAIRNYQYHFLKPNATDAVNRPEDTSEMERIKEFIEDPTKKEDSQLLWDSKQTGEPQRIKRFYAAIRATKSCLPCHKSAQGDLKEGDLISVVRISLPTRDIERGVHTNRAFLLSTALLSALLIMGGSYIIVRYVIVKPVKHLKQVSDAIAAGELNVRSEIQTGDEFEDLSYAFNRMLRNLVSMQDRLRKVNADLDRKVDELAQANLALYESNRLKSDFLATMSHELRTPLNSILGFSEVLLTNEGLKEKQQRWVRNIQTSGDQLLNLINDILDLAKIEAGKMQIRVVEFSIYDICEGLAAMFRPLSEKKNIDLRCQMEPGIPLLRQDVVKVQQILSNLLSNAIKFTPEGGRVVLKAEAGPQYLILKVIDTGVGIALDDQELIFEKFRQAGNPLTREHAGTGLGLSIVRELSIILGGEVTLQSDVGRGSTFTLRLPLQLAEEPRLEFDMTLDGIDLSKAQRVSTLLYGSIAPRPLTPEEGLKPLAMPTDQMNGTPEPG
jgi:signal transduction histidine kinase